MSTTTITQSTNQDNATAAIISESGTNAAAAAAEPGHQSAVDSGAAPAARKPEGRPASTVALPASPGAKAGAALTGAEAQHPGSTTTIEILRGKHAGVYKVHPLAAMLPRIKDDSKHQAREELKKSLRRHGQKEPAVVQGQWFLDGRNRVEIMNELGLEPIVVQFASLKTGLSPEEWIIMKNRDRRHLTDDQKLAFTARSQAWLKNERQNWLRTQTTAVAGAKSNAGKEAAHTENSTEPHPAEYPQKAADNPPKHKRGRPAGKRSEAKAAAAATGQSRYRAEWMIKLQDQAPELARAVEAGALKLKEAVRQFKERRKPQPATAPADRPNDTPYLQRVISAVRDGQKALNTILDKRRVRNSERGDFWEQIALLAQREATQYGKG